MATNLNKERLSDVGLYKCGRWGDIPVVLYDDDRWILPVVLEAQNSGILPRPTTLVTLDQHHDALPPRKGIEPLSTLRAEGYPWDDFISTVGHHLSPLDDDWIQAGMELGLLDNVVAFGVWQHRDDIQNRILDHTGQSHLLLRELALPGDALRFQGSLSDLADEDENAPLWDVLGWHHDPDKGFLFDEPGGPLAINIDLDCFAVCWRGFTFPWPEEVFEREFLRPSDYFTTEGMSGKDFFGGLLKRAHLVTIAREPDWCGGSTKADHIFEIVNRMLFDGRIEF